MRVTRQRNPSVDSFRARPAGQLAHKRVKISPMKESSKERDMIDREAKKKEKERRNKEKKSERKR